MLPKLIDSPPERVEIKGDLVYFYYPDGTVFAQPVSVALQVVNLLDDALRTVRARNDNVIPLCELCVRHNLPRLDKP